MLYRDLYQQSLAGPEVFWRQAARDVSWVQAPTRAFFPDQGLYGRWFADGVCNTCFNAVDRHVHDGRGEQPALIYDSPLDDVCTTMTYNTLLQEVQRTAQLLLDKGVRRGDRVVIYMPMIPKTVVAMLAVARIGAIHSVVFGGFAAKELATRIDDCAPHLVLTASCGLEPGRLVAYKPLVDEALRLARHKVPHVLVLQRHQVEAALMAGRDHDWAALEEQLPAEVSVEPVPVAATDPLYILYTSGTTGQPKGVVRDQGGHMVALLWSMKHLYGLKPGEVFWSASDVGWVVGHSYIVYGPLLLGATTVLYEGKPVGTPNARAFWRVCEQHDVRVMFTAPTALRAIKKEDPQGDGVRAHDLSRLRALFLAGERADPDSLVWVQSLLGKPVIDHWWQTETGWAIAGNPLGYELQPIKPGSAGLPMPGYRVRVVDEAGHDVPPLHMGAVVIDLPLPPGALPTLWQQDKRFEESYLTDFPGCYKTADAGVFDADGYLTILGRTDDIINTAGHRLSTGSMEEVLSGHPDVAECAVVGVKDDLKGEVPVGFVVLKAGVSRAVGIIERELIQRVRDLVGPVASFKHALVVQRLPKTRSGKILRGTIKKIADKTPWAMPATVDDPAVFAEIEAVLREHRLL